MQTADGQASGRPVPSPISSPKATETLVTTRVPEPCQHVACQKRQSRRAASSQSFQITLCCSRKLLTATPIVGKKGHSKRSYKPNRLSLSTTGSFISHKHSSTPSRRR